MIFISHGTGCHESLPEFCVEHDESTNNLAWTTSCLSGRTTWLRAPSSNGYAPGTMAHPWLPVINKISQTKGIDHWEFARRQHCGKRYTLPNPAEPRRRATPSPTWRRTLVSPKRKIQSFLQQTRTGNICITEWTTRGHTIYHDLSSPLKWRYAGDKPSDRKLRPVIARHRNQIYHLPYLTNTTALAVQLTITRTFSWPIHPGICNHTNFGRTFRIRSCFFIYVMATGNEHRWFSPLLAMPRMSKAVCVKRQIVVPERLTSRRLANIPFDFNFSLSHQLGDGFFCKLPKPV